MKVNASNEVLEVLKDSLRKEGREAVRFEMSGFS